MNKIKALYKIPGDTGFRKVEVENELEAFRQLVGGYIETLTLDDSATLVVNEEGRLHGLPYCISFHGEDLLGPVVLVGVDGDEFTDVPADWIKTIDKMGLLEVS